MTGACQVCGLEQGNVRTQLVRRFEGEEYAAVARCLDRGACRARVEAAGGRWDIGDVETANGPRGFSDGHRRVFEAARKWREAQASR